MPAASLRGIAGIRVGSIEEESMIAFKYTCFLMTGILVMTAIFIAILNFAGPLGLIAACFGLVWTIMLFPVPKFFSSAIDNILKSRRQ